MIIGRTDENDLVINHRSISRNHAKVTRDPETSRYTISDLQSSNGVRVNGQDYGKVELRRGDVVDLGHVRLRFVEPGEDFVFARDAVVVDLPEGGGKRSLLVAIVLAVVVLGAAVAYFALKPNPGSGETDQPHRQQRWLRQHHHRLERQRGRASADRHRRRHRRDRPDRETSAEFKRFEGDCLTDITDLKWGDLETCAVQLDGIRPGGGQKYHAKAKLEIGAQRQLEHMQSALKDRDLKSAQKSFEKIPSESGLLAGCQEAARRQESCDRRRGHHQGSRLRAQPPVRRAGQVRHARGIGARRGRRSADRRRGEVRGGRGRAAGLYNALSNRKGRALQAAVLRDAWSLPVCGGGAVAAAQDCDKLTADGTAAIARSDYTGRAQAMEKAYQCRPDARTLSLAFMAACNSANVQRARFFWKKLSQRGADAPGDHVRPQEHHARPARRPLGRPELLKPLRRLFDPVDWLV